MLTSLANPKVKRLIQIRKSSKVRNAEKSVVVVGEKFIREAVKVAPVKMILSTSSEPPKIKGPFLQASSAVVSKIAGVTMQEGMVAEFALPEESRFTTATKLLALDGIQDPGNLGALVRSQIAFGWDKLFLLPGCCDLFNDKVVRASAATLFHLQWQKGDFAQLKALVEKSNLTPYVADMRGKDMREIAEKKICLLISNEGRGVSVRGKSFGKRVKIPMSKRVESLNAAVAGSLLLFGLR